MGLIPTLTLTVALALVATSCSSVDAVAAPGLDMGRYHAVVVNVDVSAARGAASVRSLILEGFKQELIRHGVDVVARDQLDKIIAEHGLNLSDMSAESRQQLGQLTATDAILDVKIVAYSDGKGVSGVRMRSGTIVATLIDLETGQEVWKARGDSGYPPIERLPKRIMAEWPD